MPASPGPQPLDPGAWEGDPEQLAGHEDHLANDYELCDALFASKQEAFTTALFLASRQRADVGPDASRRSQLDHQAGVEALRLVENISWGDAHENLNLIDGSLLRAMEATRADFLLWEEDSAGELRFGDEFSVSESQVNELSPQWRLAYVARLLRTLALGWGVGTEFRGLPLDSTRRDARSLAELLYGLDAIVCSRPACI